MPHVTFTAPVDIGASRIWAILSAFGHIVDWHPDIRDSRIVNGLPEPPRSRPPSELTGWRNH